MRVRVSDVRALPGFVRHLAGQGFPAKACGSDVVEILFPAQASALESAAELDLWRAKNDGVTILPLSDLERP